MKPRLYRILSLFFTALTLLLAGALYRGDFQSLKTDEAKIQAIRGYASTDVTGNSLGAVLHPVLLQDETFGDRRILTFADSEIDDLLGNIQFRRGVLGGWQPLCASYGAGPVLATDTIQDRNIRVVYAADCPPEIDRYKIQANLENNATLMAEGTVTSPRFLHVYETDRNYFPDIHLYDVQGAPLSREDYLARNPAVPSPGIGSAEINAVYVFCGLVLVIGWLVVKYCWDYGTKAPSRTDAAH